ncbi:MAG: hypothetical protein FK734_04370 [Asgard group archaeon]|nr:hypothetical protein [Asgard group archaeon]
MTWKIDDSKLIYGVNQRDLHYLDINKEGKLELILYNERITFEEIIEKFIEKTKYHESSFAIRIPQLIGDQIIKLLSAFREARKKYSYKGVYQPVYPVKVNHSRFIIDSIVKSHSDYAFESGTKSEFVLLTQTLKKEKHRLIMCNGAKDREYLTSIKKAIDKGHQVCISIETIQEMHDALDILPRDGYQLAFRIKPYVSLHGHWGASSSRHSKFGLSIGELVDVVKIIKDEGATALLTTLHAHPGSQITTLNDFYEYARFMAGIFQDLYKQGFTELKHINFGGGLPIDYDNRLDENFMSRYAEILIEVLSRELPEFQPNIMTESGRAITALSTIVVVKIIDFYPTFPADKLNDDEYNNYKLKAQRLAKPKSAKEAVENWTKWEKKAPLLTNLESLQAFEAVSYWLKRVLRQKLFKFTFFEDLMDDHDTKLLIKPEYALQGNFSIFNSICDIVLVNQYFPIIPINNLHVQPETIVRLFDITCDSDGVAAVYHPAVTRKRLFTKDHFLLTFTKPVTLEGFPIGHLDHYKDSYLAIPLAGAYQDIVEFNHNLLGDIPDVTVGFDKDKWIIKPLNGAQTIGKLLADVGFEDLAGEEDDPYYDD